MGSDEFQAACRLTEELFAIDDVRRVPPVPCSDGPPSKLKFVANSVHGLLLHLSGFIRNVLRAERSHQDFHPLVFLLIFLERTLRHLTYRDLSGWQKRWALHAAASVACQLGKIWNCPVQPGSDDIDDRAIMSMKYPGVLYARFGGQLWGVQRLGTGIPGLVAPGLAWGAAHFVIAQNRNVIARLETELLRVCAVDVRDKERECADAQTALDGAPQSLADAQRALGDAQRECDGAQHALGRKLDDAKQALDDAKHELDDAKYELERAQQMLDGGAQKRLDDVNRNLQMIRDLPQRVSEWLSVPESEVPPEIVKEEQHIGNAIKSVFSHHICWQIFCLQQNTTRTAQAGRYLLSGPQYPDPHVWLYCTGDQLLIQKNKAEAWEEASVVEMRTDGSYRVQTHESAPPTSPQTAEDYDLPLAKHNHGVIGEGYVLRLAEKKPCCQCMLQLLRRRSAMPLFRWRVV